MKVLHIINSKIYSGAENVMCRIISLFPEDEMIYCAIEGPVKESLEERNIKNVLVPEFTVKNIKKVIADVKPDIIHAHDMRASLYASLSCGRIPVVSHIHFNCAGNFVKALTYIPAAIKAKHIFWVSESAFKGYQFHGLFNRKSTVLKNIVDASLLNYKAESDTGSYDYDVVFVGRLIAEKNPQRLLNIIKKVTELKTDVKVAIVGEGELLNVTKEYARVLGLNNVSFLGFKSNPYKVVKSSKVMLMSSVSEGYPMVVLEAMSLGTPVVSTSVGGLVDLVKDDYNGYLSNDDNCLAESVCKIITDKELHDKLSKNAIEFSAKINDANEYKKQIAAVYKECL